MYAATNLQFHDLANSILSKDVLPFLLIFLGAFSGKMSAETKSIGVCIYSILLHIFISTKITKSIRAFTCPSMTVGTPK